MIEVRRIIEEDIPDLLRISLRELGEDYLGEGDFEECLGKGPEDGTFCNVAVLDGEPMGFAICQVFGPEGEKEMLDLPDSVERNIVLSTGRIGLLDSVSVDDRTKGRGLGTALCRRCVEDMVDDGCGMVCAMAWKSYSGRTNIAPLLTRLGLEETLQIQGYWNTRVDTPGGHHCPECGAPCRCYGVFWYRLV